MRTVPPVLSGGRPAAPSSGLDPMWLDNLHPALRRAWHPVARAAELGDDGCVTLMGEAWRLAPDAEGWHAEDACGATAMGAAEHLGLMWVAPEAPLAPLPVVPEADDPGFVAVDAPAWDWEAGAGQMTDGACDLTHIPFLHRDTIADPDDVVVPSYGVSVNADAWTASVDYSHTARALHHPSRLGPRRVVIEHTAPFGVRLRLEFPDEDAVLTSCFFHQPLTATRTRLWCTNHRTDIADGRCSPERATALHRMVNDQDRQMLELYPGKALPLDLRHEVHVRADRITVEVRRSLRRLVATAAAGA